MERTLQFVIHHGSGVLFIWVVLEQGGLPIPAAPVLLEALGTAEQAARGAHRRSLLGSMVFGIVASVGGPGFNVLLRIVTLRGVGTLDLLAWVLFTLPIALTVWMLPPRGLAPRIEPRSGQGDGSIS